MSPSEANELREIVQGLEMLMNWTGQLVSRAKQLVETSKDSSVNDDSGESTAEDEASGA